jgi:hypothetical protein
MSASQERRTVEGLPAWHDAPWQYRVGLSLLLCTMALLLIAPLLPWFHTELIRPLPGLSGVSLTSFLEYLGWLIQVNLPVALAIALTYLFWALSASIAGIRTLAAIARHRVRRSEQGDARVGVLAPLFGIGLLGIFLGGMNGSIPLGWPPARVVFDVGFYATLAGFVVALLGNTLITLARGKAERPALV